MKLYLVEDDQADVEAISRIFRGANVPELEVVFRDGQEAYEYFQSHSAEILAPHLLLLDLNTPRMSGLELLRRVRADDSLKGLRVVVITTSRHTDDENEARELGALDFINKADLGSKLLPSISSWRI